jgi:hypothetical protein
MTHPAPPRRHGQKRAPFDVCAKRVREIAMLVLHRHRGLPGTDDRSIYLEAAAYHLKPRDGDLEFALTNWARRLGGALPAREINRIVKKIRAKPRRFRADTMGKLLRVTYDERTALQLSTIGCYDVSKAERSRWGKERRRLKEQGRRRNKGAVPREQYLAKSLSRRRPWLAEGISRRTWYRRRQAPVAQVRADLSSCIPRHGRVPASELPYSGGVGGVANHTPVSSPRLPVPASGGRGEVLPDREPLPSATSYRLATDLCQGQCRESEHADQSADHHEDVRGGVLGHLHGALDEAVP